MKWPVIIFTALLSACGSDAPYMVINDSIEMPLTKAAPDPLRGKTLFSSRGDAHCVLCHKHDRSDAAFQGDMGPDLSSVSSRLTPAQIRLRIADYEKIKPGTVMPSYYRTENFRQVSSEISGKTVLSALEIEDIIAFLGNNETH